jgi:phosphatidylglycerophosphatase A
LKTSKATNVTDNRDAVSPELDSERVKIALAEAARGGWPEGPYCSLGYEKKTIWAWTIGTFFGAGFGKPGPGTWGSVAALLLWSGTALLLHPSPAWMLGLTLAGIALSVGLGVPASTIAARESGGKDPGFVVIDEVAGQWITLLALTGHKPDLNQILAALLLFRVFDVWKPYPIRKIENLPEGWGIVFDDVAAGLYAWSVLLLVSRWL